MTVFYSQKKILFMSSIDWKPSMLFKTGQIHQGKMEKSKAITTNTNIQKRVNIM